MSIYMDISRMNRLVLIVAKGHVTADEIAANTKTLVEADVPGYAKIIDTTGSRSDLTRDQVEKIATLLRGDPKDRTRGPVAFVVNPDRKGFADAFAEVTQGERAIQLSRASTAHASGCLKAAPTPAPLLRAVRCTTVFEFGSEPGRFWPRPEHRGPADTLDFHAVG